MLRDVLGAPGTDDFGAFGMRVLSPTTLASQRSQRPARDDEEPQVWDGNPTTIIDIKSRSSSKGSQSQVVELTRAEGSSTRSRSRDELEMKTLEVA